MRKNSDSIIISGGFVKGRKDQKVVKNCLNCKYWTFLWIELNERNGERKKREGGCSENRIITNEEGWCTSHRRRPKRIDIKEIREEIKEIKKIKNEDDDAHLKEDNLWLCVMIDISRGIVDPQKIAKETLKTKNIRFARWVG